MKLQSLSKTYDGDIEAVRSLNLTINKGEIYGFLGPNGAGKSTTIKMIIGLLKPSSGTIQILGESNSHSIISEKIGYVPQELIFYDHLTVLENIELFASLYEIDQSKNKIKELLELLEIDELASRRAETLSGGQKRRLNLTLGLLHTPDILVLDEPSAGMDPQSRNILWRSIRNIANKHQVTIILTTHLMETVDRIADRIGIIDHGTIIAEGTSEELKQLYGGGDILEVTFKSENAFDKANLYDLLKSKYPDSDINMIGVTLRVRMQHIISQFTEIMQDIHSLVNKIDIEKVIIHENTLEDVFIDLTGRELRE